MNDKARHIRERFKDKGHIIDLLMVEDPEFLTLCEDFDACVDALRHWTDSKEPEAEARVNEYSTIIEELEEEITQALAAVPPGRQG
ncbi:MAG: hypothetical protein AMK69_21435 [Nitrospira bacterium SG8_3]|nr:MAG: hypothetical protein AMK69_21435 [Nitrospira bacterium SG8_3]